MSGLPDAPTAVPPTAPRWPALARLFRFVGRVAMVLLGVGAVVAVFGSDPSAPLTLRDFYDVQPRQQGARILFITGLGMLLLLPLIRNVIVIVTAQGAARASFVRFAALGFGLVLLAYGIAAAQLFAA